MPKNAKTEEKLVWHLNHSKNCKCREMPESTKEELKRRGLICVKLVAVERRGRLNNKKEVLNLTRQIRDFKF